MDECSETSYAAIAQTIKPINVDTVHKICSGQVVLSLAVAVKELVENALDAGSTSIDIRLKNYGIDLIEVSDNGSGVTEDNFSALTLKYHTSKLSDYSDLLGVTSFGFRGEALSSLSELADLSITTRHKSSEHATKLEYDHKGEIKKKTPCSRQIGTTVSLSNLFYSLPVRQKEFHKNVKREFNKMTQLLYAYCLISLGVKITCYNQTNTNSKSLVVGTQGSNSYKDNIACVFGLKQLHSILEIKPEVVTSIKDNILKGLSGEVNSIEESVNIEDVEIDLSEDSNDADTSKKDDSGCHSQKSQGYKNVVNPVEFTGFISSCAHGSGRSSTDRQFYYVNSRPCEPIKITKLINETYRQYNPHQYPFVLLNINLERTSVDVNVTPDKRKVFLTKEKIILDVLKNSILKLFENIPRIVKVDTSIIGNKDLTKSMHTDNQPKVNSFLQQFSNKYNTTSIDHINKEQVDSKKVDLKRKSTTLLDFVSSKSSKGNTEISQKTYNTSDTIRKDITVTKSETETLLSVTEVNNMSDVMIIEKDDKEIINCVTSGNNYEKDKDILVLGYTDALPNTQIRSIDDIAHQETSHTIYCKTKSMYKKISSCDKIDKVQKQLSVITDKEDLGKQNRRSVTLKTSLEHVKILCDIYEKENLKSVPDKIKFRSSINPLFNKKCEEELNREISKESFNKMKIIGQFNLGFIITQLDEDLFIIDQHATDEIYNFEILQKTTELTSQKLVIPQQLELTGVNEQILMDNLDVFKRNGFTFEINEAAPPTKRVKLLTIPMSKNWIFGKEDIEELLFMLRESYSEYCRPSRVRAMFASRACRKSVMIGTALSKSDMKKLVEHMAEIDKPWNCPHGRPTIRHLVNLAMVHTNESSD